MKAKELARTRSGASAKRRVAYSLAAGAAATTVGSAADAAVVYSGLRDTAVSQGHSLGFDLDSNNNVDITMKNYVFGGGNYQGATVEFAPGKLVAFPLIPNGIVYASALAAGTTISTGSLGPTFYGSIAYSANPNAQFNTPGEGYIGFGFQASNNPTLYLAWMRIAVNNATGTLVIRDWAYDNVRGASIKVGYRGVPGDYNTDGVVDASDFTEWVGQFGADKSQVAGADADGNANGVVDAADYVVWRQHLGQTQPPAGAGASAAVPEPTTLGLLAAGAAGLCLMRRLRHA